MEKINFEAVTLSIDSVLYDLNTYKQQIYARIMEKHGLEVHPFFFELLLDGGYQQIERAFIHYNQYRPIRLEMEEAYKKQFEFDLENKNLKPHPESIEFVKWLMSTDVKIGLVSSYSKHQAQELINQYPLDLSNYLLVAGNEVLEGKPEKDIYSKMAKKLKADPHYTLAIEATVNGVMGAYLANMISAYVEIHKLRVEKAQKFSNYQCVNLERAKALI